MKSSSTFIIHPNSEEQENALKAFVKALKIKFEIATDSPYSDEFVAKIKASKKQYEQGEFITVANEDLESFLGLK